MQTNRDWLVNSCRRLFFGTTTTTTHSIAWFHQINPDRNTASGGIIRSNGGTQLYGFRFPSKRLSLIHHGGHPWWTTTVFIFPIIQGEIFCNNRVVVVGSSVVRFGFASFYSIRSSLGLLYAIEKSCGILIGAKMVVDVLSTPREIITCFSVFGPVAFVFRWSFDALKTSNVKRKTFTLFSLQTQL